MVCWVGRRLMPVQRRLRRFQRAHLIERRTPDLTTAALGAFVLALVLVALDRDSTEQRAAPGRVLRSARPYSGARGLAGEYDYAITLVTRNERLYALLKGLIVAPSIMRFVKLVKAWRCPSAER